MLQLIGGDVSPYTQQQLRSRDVMPTLININCLQIANTCCWLTAEGGTCELAVNLRVLCLSTILELKMPHERHCWSEMKRFSVLL